MNGPALVAYGILEALKLSEFTCGQTWAILALLSNAAVYGLVGALGAMWLNFGRRMRRLERGLCQSCGYNLTGNTTGVCPECAGKVIAP